MRASRRCGFASAAIGLAMTVGFPAWPQATSNPNQPFPPTPPAVKPTLIPPPIVHSNVPASPTVLTIPPGAGPVANGQPVPTVVQVPQAFVQPKSTTPPNAIVYDAEFKEYTAKPGESNALFTFYLTNSWTADVTVTSVRPSCGCTMAKLPNVPWILKPGESGPLEASIDLRGKRGTLNKSLMVDSSSGFKALMFKVTIPDAAPGTMGDPDRLRNMQLAMANRQIVFQGDCAKCHAEPTLGKSGRELYTAACAICHDSPLRASMVTDLKALQHPTDANYWKRWIAYGRVGSLMPAFAKAENGPLTDEQIDSLVEYLVQTIPTTASVTTPQTAPPAAPAPAAAGTESIHTEDQTLYAFPFPKSQ